MSDENRGLGEGAMDEIQSYFEQLNADLFENKLPRVQCMENGRLRKTFGRCHLKYCHQKKLWMATKIDIRKGLTPEEMRKTMVHEMCHVWAVHFFQERGHGRQFWKQMKACGYPDGHRLFSGQNDVWVNAASFEFYAGQVIRWEHQRKVCTGSIQSINRRTVTVRDQSGQRWRLSPAAVQVIAHHLSLRQFQSEQRQSHVFSEAFPVSLDQLVGWSQDNQMYHGVVVLLRSRYCIVETSAGGRWSVPYSML